MNDHPTAADKRHPVESARCLRWLLPLLIVLGCSSVLAAGFNWKPGQGKPLERLNIDDYPGDPLYQTISQAREEMRLAGEMVRIPGGSLRMGADDGGSSERPVHPVAIAPFLLGRYEVTQTQWRMVMGDDPAGFSRCGDCPVVEVSWGDVQAFIEALNRRTGWHYHLPTEAEWEYAARAGSATNYSWGDDIGRGRANCDGCGSRWDDERSAPVGSFRPNAFGLYDMHGNVWEWTRDCWHYSYEGAPGNGSAWESGTCERRVVRGGSWGNTPEDLRAVSRVGYGPDYWNERLGVRLARDL